MIKVFQGEYSFLSNFFPVETFGYPTSEHAYQAAKFPRGSTIRAAIKAAPTPNKAKRLSYTAVPQDGFHKHKLEIMEAILRDKFSDELLALRLVNTYPHAIVEGNNQHDNFWGSCTCGTCPPGLNHLGLLLQKIRAELMTD